MSATALTIACLSYTGRTLRLPKILDLAFNSVSFSVILANSHAATMDIVLSVIMHDLDEAMLQQG